MSESHQPQRLRPAPRERFAESQIFVDLDRHFEALATEEHDGVDGHRQITLYKGEGTTVVALLFERQGFFRPHQIDGLVTLQVLEGKIALQGPQEKESQKALLGPGSMLILESTQTFSLRAEEPSRMLFTVATQSS